jgi:uncharacterized membrane protein
LIRVLAFIKEGDEACNQVINKIEALKNDLEFELNIIPLNESELLEEKYINKIPLVKVGPYALDGNMDSNYLRMTISAAIDRDRQLTEVGDTAYKKRLDQGRVFSKFDRISLWISKSYIWLMAFFLFLYVGLPFMAPVFMNAGLNLPAKVIYVIYKPLCHQLAFRSYFIFGDQPFYPRTLAGIEGVQSYEEITNQKNINIRDAQKFVGNEKVGYKVALCERDVAIYGSMLLFAIIFILTRRRINSLPWYFWLILGLIPIGIDGVSQLPSLAASLPSWLPIRESTPLLRTITGMLFGITTSWYLFPLLEESMRETRFLLTEKKAIQKPYKSENN